MRKPPAKATPDRAATRASLDIVQPGFVLNFGDTSIVWLLDGTVENEKRAVSSYGRAKGPAKNRFPFSGVEQRSQTGWIGVPKREVILGWALGRGAWPSGGWLSISNAKSMPEFELELK